MGWGGVSEQTSVASWMRGRSERANERGGLDPRWGARERTSEVSAEGMPNGGGVLAARRRDPREGSEGRRRECWEGKSDEGQHEQFTRWVLRVRVPQLLSSNRTWICVKKTWICVKKS